MWVKLSRLHPLHKRALVVDSFILYLQGTGKQNNSLIEQDNRLNL
jgi:hypothetical protein